MTHNLIFNSQKETPPKTSEALYFEKGLLLVDRSRFHIIINKGQTIIEGSVSELMNAQETILSIELLDKGQQALEFLQGRFSAGKAVLISPKKLELTIERNLVPTLNAALVNAGFEVVALEPKRTLEDFFIQMTQS